MYFHPRISLAKSNKKRRFLLTFSLSASKRFGKSSWKSWYKHVFTKMSHRHSTLESSTELLHLWLWFESPFWVSRKPWLKSSKLFMLNGLDKFSKVTIQPAFCDFQCHFKMQFTKTRLTTKTMIKENIKHSHTHRSKYI